VLAHCLRNEGLSNSRWAKGGDDQTVSLAFDEAVESDFFMVGFDKRLEVLAIVGEDESEVCIDLNTHLQLTFRQFTLFYLPLFVIGFSRLFVSIYPLFSPPLFTAQ